jgi:4-diphosphocytidyl-2-C-methyl-D-erythritol kinase
LCDELTITRERDGGLQFTCDDPSLPANDDNLVVRAARLFFAEIKCDPSVRIGLKKRIPHAAGLGGGSSDAAATLRGLNDLHERPLNEKKLNGLAAQLGSDVPFFLCETAAMCRGRGEIVEPKPLAHSLPLLLLKPAFGVPTPWAYQRWRESRELPGILYSAQQDGELSLINNLERPVFEKYVFLGQMKTWLLAQSEVAAALLSGSGSTMFAVLHAESCADVLARRARAELDPELWTSECLTRSRSQSRSPQDIRDSTSR